MNRIVGKRPLSWAASGSKKALKFPTLKKKKKKVSQATEKPYLAPPTPPQKKKKRRKVNIEAVSLESNVPPATHLNCAVSLRIDTALVHSPSRAKQPGSLPEVGPDSQPQHLFGSVPIPELDFVVVLSKRKV